MEQSYRHPREAHGDHSFLLSTQSRRRALHGNYCSSNLLPTHIYCHALGTDPRGLVQKRRRAGSSLEIHPPARLPLGMQTPRHNLRVGSRSTLPTRMAFLFPLASHIRARLRSKAGNPCPSFPTATSCRPSRSPHHRLITGRRPRPQPRSSGLYRLHPPSATHASHSSNVTAKRPTEKGFAIVTMCSGLSLSSLPSSVFGAPLMEFRRMFHDHFRTDLAFPKHIQWP